eukprot:2962686-Rhodomonas_salina.2
MVEASMLLVVFDGQPLDPNSVTIKSQTPAYTLLEFTTLPTARGTVAVQVIPQPCTVPCSDAVRFTFVQVDSSLPTLVAPVPVRGAIQRTSFPPILLSNFNFSDPNAGAVEVGFKNASALISAQVLSAREVGSVYEVTVEPPSALMVGAYTLEVSATLYGVSKQVSFPFQFYDGTALRIISVDPASLPASPTIQSRLVLLRSSVSIIAANLAANLKPVNITVLFSGGSRAVITSVSDVASCSGLDQIDCRRTQIELVVPASESPGVSKAR